MNKFKTLLDQHLSIDRYKVRFDIDSKYNLLLTEAGISHGYTVSIKKDYKGYFCEVTEWISQSFGKRSTINSTKQKDIFDFLKSKVEKRKSFMFVD